MCDNTLVIQTLQLQERLAHILEVVTMVGGSQRRRRGLIQVTLQNGEDLMNLVVRDMNL